MTSLTLTVPNENLPVTVAEQKLHMRVTSSAQDSVIETQIAAATSWCEAVAGLKFMLSTWVWREDHFPWHRALVVPSAPVASVESIYYVASDGTDTLLDPSAYKTSLYNNARPIIVPAFGTVWPQTRCEPDAVRIELKLGFPAPEAESPALPPAHNVPAKYKAAIKLIAAELFERREEAITATTILQVEVSARRLIGAPITRFGA